MDLLSPLCSGDPHDCVAVGKIGSHQTSLDRAEFFPDIQTKVSENHIFMESPYGTSSGLGVLSSHPQLP